eukprot:TRINITY_DN77526_c0_g1_i1.p1 TRINITY_DN77526_c0_g1~~TRINITY_DN77526_c0_g1_i1.p1  ORF type:complete len:825 (+),score=16.65 TRINITY_DN77526_c0_g1_i1:259-2475(+)
MATAGVMHSLDPNAPAPPSTRVQRMVAEIHFEVECPEGWENHQHIQDSQQTSVDPKNPSSAALVPLILSLPDASEAPLQAISQWEAALQSMVEEQMRTWCKLANKGIFTRRRTKSGKKAAKQHQQQQLLQQNQRAKGRNDARVAPEDPLLAADAVSFASGDALLTDDGAPESVALRELRQKQQLEANLAKHGRTRAALGLLTLGIFLAPVSLCLLFALTFPAIFVALLGVWAVMEVVFAVVRYFQLRYISDNPPLIPSPSLESVEALFKRILNLGEVVEVRDFIEGWFHGTPLARLHRGHIKQFIAFGFYYRAFEQLSADYQAAVEYHVSRLESRWSIAFPLPPHTETTIPADVAANDAVQPAPVAAGVAADGTAQPAADVAPSSTTTAAIATQAVVGAAAQAGRAVTSTAAAAAAGVAAAGTAAAAAVEGAIEFMAHTREPLRAVVHPLAFYAWGHTVGLLTAIALSSLHFRKHITPSGLHYWYRAGKRVRKTAAPSPTDGCDSVVLVHGLGVGVTPYLAFLHMLMTAFDRKPFFVVELPHLACQLSATCPTVEELTDGLAEALKKHHAKRVAYIGHSYGTFIAATFLRRYRPLVASMGLIDPVCVLLCLPKVLHSFVYKYPEAENTGAQIGETLRWFLCSRELQVATAICRRFAWQEYQVWGDELPAASLVMLSGDDQLVPSPAVQRHLAQHSVEMIYNDGFHHAEFLTRPDVQQQFVLSFVAACGKSAHIHAHTQ